MCFKVCEMSQRSKDPLGHGVVMNNNTVHDASDGRFEICLHAQYAHNRIAVTEKVSASKTDEFSNQEGLKCVRKQCGSSVSLERLANDCERFVCMFACVLKCAR